MFQREIMALLNEKNIDQHKLLKAVNQFMSYLIRQKEVVCLTCDDLVFWGACHFLFLNISQKNLQAVKNIGARFGIFTQEAESYNFTSLFSMLAVAQAMRFSASENVNMSVDFLKKFYGEHETAVEDKLSEIVKEIYDGEEEQGGSSKGCKTWIEEDVDYVYKYWRF